jgi:hypothetical protein
VLHGAPIVRATVGGQARRFLIDTGSSMSLIHPSVCLSRMTPAEVTPIGVNGAELEVRGKQVVKFTLSANTYNHVFTVCKLATEVGAILGTDFCIL